MNQLLSAMEDGGNTTVTENGAGAFLSTKSSVLDFFAIGCALRNHSEKEQVDLFAAAWDENPELALKAMFYARDIRGGQGQRGAFRNQLKYLASISPDTVRSNLALIPEYGRWDDLYQLVDTKLEDDAFELMREQLMKDVSSETPSILAKWLKSANASSSETVGFGKRTAKAFGMKPSQYRKTLSALRARLNVVEQKISSGKWEEITYPTVPSLAMMKYRKAFAKHDSTGFQSFIDAAIKGEVKMNAGTLYPYEIIEKIGVFGYNTTTIDPQLAQVMWDNLPDYTEGKSESAIAVVDTSGSMQGTPINVAVSLGMYFAERAEGPFKDHFITFSDRPKLQKIMGKDIVSKVRKIGKADWGMSTNLEAVFSLILKSAVAGKVPQSEMVDKIYIISDMQFNCVQDGSSDPMFAHMKTRYAEAGYEVPNVVFWNVNPRINNQPVTMDERGTQLVSGFSPSTFAYLMGAAFVTPYELMVEVLGSDRYAPLSVS